MRRHETPKEQALPDGTLRIFEPDPEEGDRTRMYVLDVLGVSLMVYQKKNGRLFVYVDPDAGSDAPKGSRGLALAVEVGNSGENLYGEDCTHEWAAGMMAIHPEDAVEVDKARRAAGEDGVECHKCGASRPLS